MRGIAGIVVALGVVAVALAGGCGTEDGTDGLEVGPGDKVKGMGGKEDSSVLATVLDFEFEGSLVTDWAWDNRRVVQDQLLYTIGHLNHDNSVGRLDRLEILEMDKKAGPGTNTTITYKARMPVAWGSKTDLPESYTLTLPRDVSGSGQEAFTKKYKSTCAESGAHDVDSGSMWYYYRPQLSACKLADGDVVRLDVAVTVSAVNTTGKYPEYHKVWEDETLKVVAVFGKYEDGAKTAADAGIAAYNEFVAAVSKRLAPYSPETTPSPVPEKPGTNAAAVDVEFRATLTDGHKVQVNALLVDNIANASAEFYERYEGLSTQADLIAYNGHAGLGQNVRALAKKGKWVTGQYVIVFMNGCDTFAYVDGSLADIRKAVNPDDPTGTKYLDFVVNAMPAYFASDAEASMSLINGLLAADAPETYEQIFRRIDPSQVVLVTGEQDNVYYPGYDPNGPPVEPPAGAWAGMSEEGTVAQEEEKRYQTPTLAAGTYLFTLAGDGDADLYVRTGTAPSADLFDCRPYKEGSDETCKVTLGSPAVVHVMVRGFADASTYSLDGSVQQ
jgi:hypothetical protein